MTDPAKPESGEQSAYGVCPKCGAPAMHVSADFCDYTYRCGTMYHGGLVDSQSPACYATMRSRVGIGPLAKALGYTPPISDDNFWYREDHGPVHIDDLPPFLATEVAAHLAVAKAATKGLYVMQRCVPAIYDELINGASAISYRELDTARAELRAALSALPAATTKTGE